MTAARVTPQVRPPEELPLADVREIAARYGLQELAVFGSVARGEADSGSDVDLLYVRGPGTPHGFAFYSLVGELEALLGRPVDLVAKAGLRWVIRERVLAEAKVLYAAP